MLTVKRKVDTDEERYGGFDRGAAVHTIDVDYDTENGRSYSEAQNARAETVAYSGRPSVGVYPVYTETAKRMPQEEFMPGIAAKKTEDQRVAPAAKSHAKLELKTKAMLAVYLVVVIALAAVVIATGVAISAANNRVDSLVERIDNGNRQLLEQSRELYLLNDEDAIRGKADGNGMITADNAVAIPLIPVQEPTEYQGSTNWFDKFCDFIGGIFGG